MSVPKHINQIHTNSLLFLQDMKSTKMISLVVQVNRLYKLMRSHKHAQAHDLPFICKYVKHIDSLLSFHTIPQTSIWHFRLGSLSNHILYDMPRLYPSITNDNKSLYGICHYKKNHTKLVCLILFMNSPFYILTFGDPHPHLSFTVTNIF